MKRLLMVAMAAVCCSVFAQEPSGALASARSQIDKAIAEPAEMTKLMATLSADEQTKFVADVNAAIAAMPGSDEERTATFLNVDRAALRGAAKGNLQAVVAEVFATVPVESLPVINESFAKDVFNRSANPSVTYSDEDYKHIALAVMTNAVNTRVASADNADVRAGFAALMLIRASNNQSPDMINAIASALPESCRETAVNEWFPSALGDGQQKYAPMLGMADAGREPDSVLVILIAGPQNFEALLTDLQGGGLDPLAHSDGRNPVVDAIQNTTQYGLGAAGAHEIGNDAAGASSATFNGATSPVMPGQRGGVVGPGGTGGGTSGGTGGGTSGGGGVAPSPYPGPTPQPIPEPEPGPGPAPRPLEPTGYRNQNTGNWIFEGMLK